MDSVSRQLLLSGGAGVMPADPLSIWTMDNLSGNIVIDEKGSLNGTKTSTTTSVAGRTGNALRTVTANLDRIDMGNRKAAYDTATNSVAMWVKFNSLSGGQYLFTNHNRQGGTGSTYNNGWLMTITSSGNLYAYNTILNNESWTDGGTGGGSGNDYTPRVSAPAGTLTTTGYYHIACVSGPTYITLYVNNIKIGTTTHTQTKRTGTGDASINGHYAIGGYVYDNSNALSGVSADIDETRHYNFALTDANVTWLYFNT